MRGIEIVVTTRAYLSDVHWLTGVAAGLTKEAGKMHGTADAIRWARDNIERLQKQVTYLEFDNASKLHQVNELKRKIKKVSTV